MRYLASAVNRTWLIIIGAVLLVAGLVGTLISQGGLQRVAATVGLSPSLNRPAPNDPILNPDAVSFVNAPLGVLSVIIVGLVLFLAGLLWLLRQIPRRGLARPFRLHDDVGSGITQVDSQTVADAVRRQIESFHDVSQVVAQLRGTARDPELSLKITADERANIAHLLNLIQTTVVTDLQTALDTNIARLAVQLEIGRGHTSAGHVTLPAGSANQLPTITSSRVGART